MNADRRKMLQLAVEKIIETKVIIEAAKEDEQTGYDNLPEGLQQSEKGEKMETNVSSLEDAVSSLDDAEEYINDAINN